MPILPSLLAFLLGYSLSLLFFLGRTMARGPRTALLIVMVSLTLAAPLAIPDGFPVYRCLIATTLVFLLMKGWEVHLHPQKYARVSLRRYAAFLMNHCLIVPADADDLATGLPLRSRVRFFAVRTLYITLATAALHLVFRYDWSRHSFWSEHFAKTIASFAWIDCAFPWYGAVWQLAGFRIVRFVDHLSQACTPAEFWKRYHRNAYEWLYRDVFRPLKTLKHPGAALMVTFALSGLMHEYILAVSLGRVTGYMVLFFALQGLAALLTWRLSLTGASKLGGLIVTYAFLLASSVYFFAPVNEGIAFYTNALPSWVMPW